MAHIFLYGPPGSGKTTLGKRLAESLRLPFVDLDQVVESRAGMSILQLMKQHGETAFREMESRALREQSGRPDLVIALGGGTLLREENRALARRSGTIICLMADYAQLLPRLQADANPRPLLAGDLGTELAALLAARRDHYASFGEHVDANQPAHEVFRQVQVSAGRFHLSAMGEYDVMVERGCLGSLGEMLRDRGVSHPLLVSDEKVSRLYSGCVLESLKRAGFDSKMLAVQGGESCKTLGTVGSLWRGFLEAGLDRTSTVVALGGGVVGDLAGFAAATFMRGIHWVCVPTTVLSMVDASIGGKTGFDLPEGKNLVGSFHAPQLVLSDPDVLGTLSKTEFRAGLAEVVKHGVVADPALFKACAQGLASVEEHIVALIRRAIAVKVRVIETDPYETGERAALNFGHTVGHAIELVSGFSIPHGEAVAIGMVAESRLAERLGIASPGLSAEIAAVLSGLGLPVHIPRQLPHSALARAMYSDKKRAAGTVMFAFPVDIGRVQVGIALGDPSAALEEDGR